VSGVAGSVVAAGSWLLWRRPYWGAAELWAIAILVLPSVVSGLLTYVAHRPSRFFSRLITGQDGKWSTSKAGYLLWTYALFFALLATLIHRHDFGTALDKLQPEYLVVLGIPAAAGFGAKAIRSQSPDANAGSPAPPQTNPLKGVGDLVSDDDGDTAMHKVQYLGFNLLLLGYFLVQFLSNEDAQKLPNLPDTLVGLTGVGAAAYLAQKGLSAGGAGGATIRSINPKRGPAGAAVTLLGVNLATPASPVVRVLIDGYAASAVTVQVGDAVTTVNATLPTTLQPGVKQVTAIAYDGSTSNAVDFEVL
jgi:hypothetical protein